MLSRNTFTIGAGLLTRRNGRPKVSSSVRLKQPTFSAGLPTPPKRATEGLPFSPAKSMPPGDSQVRA